MSPQGNRLFYSTFIGGPTTDANEGIALSPEGRVTVTGWVFFPGGYPTTPGAPYPSYIGGQADVVVTTLDLLLDGVVEYGTSTPACLGPLRIGVTELAVAGDADFALYCSGAPPDAQGWLYVSTAPAPLVQADPASAVLWIDREARAERIPVQSDPFGYAEVAFPLAPTLAGRRLYFQYLFANPSSCTGAVTTSASRGLEVFVHAP